MGRRSRGKSPPKRWESDTRPNKPQTFSKIYGNMLTSPAWLDLTKPQRVLYIVCRDQGYRPHPRLTGMAEDDSLFNMNRGLYAKYYKLYSEHNSRDFIKDMRALVSHGFISVIERHARKKNIYAYSDKWKYWTKEKGCELTGNDMAFLTITKKQ